MNIKKEIKNMKELEISEGYNPDIIFVENGKWYFLDETYLYRRGPFPDKETAIHQLNEYVREMFERETFEGEDI